MEKVKPFVRCSDYWPNRIPKTRLIAYKELIDEGQIAEAKVIYNKSAGSTMVSYKANQPHEWVLERLRALVEDIER